MSITVASILDQVLDPLANSVTPESAERILQFRLDSKTRDRIDDLAAKAGEGALSEAERMEYSAFVDAMDLVGVLQAKVRDAMARQAR
jgi:hypothetical protein